MLRLASGLAVLALGLGSALGQVEPAPAESKSPAAPLQGPSVPESSKPTLVEHESDGTVRRPEVPPEVAALRLLSLPAQASERIQELLDKRAKFFDSLIEKNLELLSKLDTAGKTNDKLDQALLGIEALSKLVPLTQAGSLKKQLRELLPGDQVQRFDALLKEYWDAIVAQEQKKDGKKIRFQIVTTERLQSLTRELTAAYQRLEKSGTLLFQYFFHKVKLSREQETEIRALLDEFVEKTKGSPTKQQEQEIFFDMMSKLDVKQQAEVMKQFRAPPPKKEATKRRSDEATKGEPKK